MQHRSITVQLLKYFSTILGLTVLVSWTVFAGGFDNLGFGARPVALGGAFVSIADDPSAVFYNPAGLSQIRSLSISSMYSRLFPSVQDDNLNLLTLSGAMPIGIIGTFGVGGSFFSSDLWKESMFIASYSRTIYAGFSVGGSVKFLQWSASAPPGESSLSFVGLSFDAGAHYVMSNIIEGSDLRLGVVVHDITQPSIAKNSATDAKLPLKIEVGASYVSTVYNYLIAASLGKEGDDVKLRGGTELVGLSGDMLNTPAAFLIRAGAAGILNNKTQGELNGGFGIRMGGLNIDYAYVYFFEISNLGGSHKISLSYSF
jgi:hypothetical protein